MINLTAVLLWYPASPLSCDDLLHQCYMMTYLIAVMWWPTSPLLCDDLFNRCYMMTYFPTVDHLHLSRCPLLHQSLQPRVLRTIRVVIQPESSGWLLTYITNVIWWHTSPLLRDDKLHCFAYIVMTFHTLWKKIYPCCSIMNTFAAVML